MLPALALPALAPLEVALPAVQGDTKRDPLDIPPLATATVIAVATVATATTEANATIIEATATTEANATNTVVIATTEALETTGATATTEAIAMRIQATEAPADLAQLLSPESCRPAVATALDLLKLSWI